MPAWFLLPRTQQLGQQDGNQPNGKKIPKEPQGKTGNYCFQGAGQEAWPHHSPWIAPLPPSLCDHSQPMDGLVEKAIAASDHSYA